MKLKSKILLGVFGAVALTAVPVSIALTATSCGDGSSQMDGSPDSPVQPSPAPSPDQGVTPPPAPAPTPSPSVPMYPESELTIGSTFDLNGFQYTVIQDPDAKSKKAFELSKLLDYTVADPSKLADSTGQVVIDVPEKGRISLPLVQIGSISPFGPKPQEGKNWKGHLVIPNTVKIIKEMAFANCQGFTGDLIIPNSVREIGNTAFQGLTGCKGRLVISNSMTYIAPWTFYSCGFTGELVIPSSVTEIGIWAFQYSEGFTSLNLPSSVLTIGANAFEGCTGFAAQTLTKPAGANWDPAAFTDTKITVAE